MRRPLVTAATLAVIGCVAPATSAHADGSGVVTRNGRVGDLQLGHSTRDDVRRFAGRATGGGSGEGEGGVALSWWRYRCGRGCNTFFYFDSRGRLANFRTRSRRYHTADGTRVGDDIGSAERQEHKRAQAAVCGDGYYIERVGKAWLYVSLNQAVTRVTAITAAGHNGVLGC